MNEANGEARDAGEKLRSPKIDSLTGLRFVAAAMIVIHHSRGVFGIPQTFLPGISLQHGVSFFFVLSGFILTYAYPSLPDRRSTARFLAARIARVWPAHVFAFCVAVALGLGDGRPGIGLANIAMVHAWVPATGWFFSYNAVSWSISTEFFFYLAFPVLIAGFRTNWWWKIALAALVVLGAVTLCERGSIAPYANANPSTVNRAGILYISPVTRLFEFVLGMLTANFWRRGVTSALSRPAMATLTELGCVVLCIAAVAFFSAKAFLTTSFGINWTTYLGHAGAAPAFALLIFVFASQRGMISKLFTRPIAVVLGEISFSAYLLHQLMIRWLVTHRESWMGLAEPSVYCIFWVALLLLSWVVWRFVETPARLALMRFAPAR